MNIQDLMARVGGQILANKARATVDGQSIVIGVFEGTELVFTPAGKAMADREDNIVAGAKQDAPKQDAPKQDAPKATGKKANAKAAPAVESAPVEPEIDLGAE